MSDLPVYARCPLAVVSVRARPDHGAAQVTQLLFGEWVRLLDRGSKGWSKVRCTDGHCTGWVADDQLRRVSARPGPDYAYCLELLAPALGQRTALQLPFGARLSAYDGLRFLFGPDAYSFNGQAVAPDLLDPYPELLAKLARRFLHAPYQAGGRTVLGIDGPGLCNLLFPLFGIELPRTLGRQVRAGHDVGFVQQARPGDLLFFADDDERLTDVGLLLTNDELLYVSGYVRTAPWTAGEQASRLRVRTVRRLLPELPAYQRGSGPRRGRGGKQFELF